MTISISSPDFFAASCEYAGAACFAMASDLAAAINVELLVLMRRFISLVYVQTNMGPI